MKLQTGYISRYLHRHHHHHHHHHRRSFVNRKMKQCIKRKPSKKQHQL